MMAYIIKEARLKQRSIAISLCDLKNAFGAVQYNLMKSVLVYHHILDSIQSLVVNPYADFHSYIISDSFSTPGIPLNVGCFKGTALAPLYSIYASIHSSSSLSRKNIISLVFHHLIKRIAYSIPFIGSSLRTMLLWLLLMDVKISCQ